mgnify:CR=1 FL=1
MAKKKKKKNSKNPRATNGIRAMKKLHDMETASILEHVDAFEKHEELADPKQSTPRPRSDLPKNFDKKEV